MRLRLLSFITATLLTTIPASIAQSGNDRVRIEVRVESDSDRKDIKGTNADAVTQNKTLRMAISGKPKSPETRTAKWTIYGRNLKDRSVVMLGSGDFNIELPAVGSQKVDSKQVSTTSTSAHSVVTGSGKRPKVKKVEAEGTKYAGCTVIVKDGSVVVGEFYDPPGLKQETSR